MIELDPLTGMDDAMKPLRSKLLAVPALRTKYLANISVIAKKMSWDNMGPLVATYRALIGELVAQDTRKAFATVAFERETSAEPTGALREFFEKRSKYLLGYTPKSAQPALKDHEE
jgi:hypothetical protein